ncbi:Uncharacterized protein Adt_11216 [Abeliophyllum distichum]|uniref:Uncharacterized protein n=1 Tax=Abeliophyllum distichum TaxID=126358 RepID=A0ABD1UMM6_9LAMI
MTYNRSDDDFSGLNDIPIPDDIIDQFGGSTDPIDLEDVHDDADTQTTIGSSTKRKATKQKAKCWDHFELVLTGTTHLNRHYKKCQYKYGGLDTNQTQLQFGSPGAESSIPILNNWIYSQELMRHEGLPKLIANVEFPLCLVDNPYWTKFVQKYLQLRSRLKADILESLLCLKDWDDVELRIQDKVDRIMSEELEDLNMD